jgi:hypothetical protein
MSETPSHLSKPGKWNEDDYDVLADGAVVGRIFKANAAPVGSPPRGSYAEPRLR